MQLLSCKSISVKGPQMLKHVQDEGGWLLRTNSNEEVAQEEAYQQKEELEASWRLEIC